MDVQSASPTKPSAFPWHHDGVLDRLRQLWTEEGLSASAIAAALSASVGADLSRNAVMGKVNRLGLVGKGNPDRAASVTEPDRDVAVPPSVEPPAKADVAPSVELALEPAVDLVERLPFQPPEPHLPGVGLFEARESQCRWPIGEPSSPDFRFCGEPRESTRWSWCAEHMSVGFDQRSTAKRRADYDQSQRLRAGKAKAA